MKLYHKSPCNECPWRKESLAGWLGGHTSEYYTDAVAMNEVPACHNKDFGPDNNKTAFCAGALSVMANSCVLPNDHKSKDARVKVGKRRDTFSHYTGFYEHHSEGKAYIPPYLRELDKNDKTR